MKLIVGYAAIGIGCIGVLWAIGKGFKILIINHLEKLSNDELFEDNRLIEEKEEDL